MIEKFRPVKIFTHSDEDPHPDHSAVNMIVKEVTENMNIPTYIFSIWNPFSLKKSKLPKLIEDITPYFKKKKLALKQFKSQRVVVAGFYPSVYLRALGAGLKLKKSRYAESFYKIK